MSRFSRKRGFDGTEVGTSSNWLNRTSNHADTFHSGMELDRSTATTSASEPSDDILEVAAYGIETFQTSNADEMVSSPTNVLGSVEHGKSYFDRHKIYSMHDFDQYNVPVDLVPVYREKEEIVEAIASNRVVIIVGYTACGKTTQIPQFIMDSCRLQKQLCNIVVTQPRRIAAKSVARRVSYERNWELGTVVGYQVGKDSRKSNFETLITYVTTGVLLNQLMSEKTLRRYSHIIIDEVHERDLDTDYLLLVIKKIMMESSGTMDQNTKVILMSATIDERKFANYFTFTYGAEETKIVPLVYRVLPRISYDINVQLLDDVLKDNLGLLQFIDQDFDECDARIATDVYNTAIKIIRDFDKKLMTESVSPDLTRKQRDAVLVFLPGREEIRKMHKLLEDAEKELRTKWDRSYCWDVISLHSNVKSEEQERVFLKSPRGRRKIILSTNIAESSITIEDVMFVIDFCLKRETSIDESTNLSTLKLCWASKSECEQRRGRAGRVGIGEYFPLVSERFYNECLKKDIEPEMKRSNIDKIVLWCKKFDCTIPPIELLKYALDIPDNTAVARAVATLKEVGALTIEMETSDGAGQSRYYDPYNGKLTFVGEVMNELPLPIQYTRLILFGHIYGVLDDAIVIASALSIKNPFGDFYHPIDSFMRKYKFSGASFSDLFALLRAYKEWKMERNNSEYEKNWILKNRVSVAGLRDIEATVDDISSRLEGLGFGKHYCLPGFSANPVELSAEQGLFLKLAIAGAFYPRYFVHQRREGRTLNPNRENEIGWGNEFRTVFFTGFPQENDGRLYAKRIADYLCYDKDMPVVKFGHERGKVLAIFDNSFSESIGPFSGAVFRAIKLRQLRHGRLEFPVFRSRSDDKRHLQLWDEQVIHRRGNICPSLRRLPPVNVESIDIIVVNLISPSQFWVVLKKDVAKLNRFSKIIADCFASKITHLPNEKIVPNGFCVVFHEREYYRGKILRTKDSETVGIKDVLIYFVDIGLTEWLRSSVLCDFDETMIRKGIHKEPCLAIKCRLQEIKPIVASGVHWSADAVWFMQEFCTIFQQPWTISLQFKIYCILESVMIGDINNERRRPSSLCHALLESYRDHSAYGEYAAEGYFAQKNHRNREMVKHSRMPISQGKIFELSEEELGHPANFDFPEPPGRAPAQKNCHLRGPFSSLEMKFNGMVSCFRTKNVEIENASVNSVALDHNHSIPISRMLVAAHVSCIETKRIVRCMETTIMPAVPGLTSLLSMIYAPKAELRVDMERTRYTGVLCGCGTVPVRGRNVVVNGKNDMEIVFDVDINDEDIKLINTIRHQLSFLLHGIDNINLVQLRKGLRTSFLKLLKKTRAFSQDQACPDVELVWNRIPEAQLCEVDSRLAFHYLTDSLVPIRQVKLEESQEEEISWTDGY